MQKFATYFSVMFLLLSLAMLFSVLGFNMPQLLKGDKMALFIFLNSVILVGLGVFFTMFKERIALYLQNYRREKEI